MKNSKRVRTRLCATAVIASLVGGSLPAAAVQAETNMVKADKVITICPDQASPFNGGSFEGWGTSFCWWANRLGYSDSLAKQVAEKFYSKEQGLGLNIIRYNIGGGDNPNHNHITRTDSEVPGYWKDGTEKCEDGQYIWEYDWTKDANQRNALQKCVAEYGDGIIVEGFSNSPPYFMTNSGCATGAEDPGKNNLKDDAYGAFAKYLAEVSAHFRDEWGIEFQSITAMNEPYTNYWGANSWKQEGCHFDQGASQSTMIEELKRAMDVEGFTNIVYSGTDETSIDTQISSYEKLSAEAKAIVTRIDSHTYGGTKYGKLKETALAGGENLWMSEVDGGDTEGTEAGEMGAALYFANKIIKDMNGLTPSAWIMWQIIDNHICAEGYNGNQDYGMPNTKGGFWGVAVADHDKDEIVLTKKYYAFGQFTRYIRPGFTIIGGTENSLAALDEENQKLVIVATNTKAEDVTCDFDLSMFSTVGSNVAVVRTSGDMETGENWAELENLTTYGKGFTAELKANSITTYIVDGVTSSGSAFSEITVGPEMVTGSAPWNNDTKNGCTNVVDGSLDTFFDGVGNGYVQIDLGKVYNLEAIAYSPRSGYEDRCVDATFWGSVDGESWYELYTVKETPTGQLTYVTKRAFEEDIAVRYVKYAVPDENHNCNIAEIKLFGVEASDAEVLAGFVEILTKKIAEYSAIEQGYYTEDSYNALQQAISAAESGKKDSVAVVQSLIAAMNSAYEALEISDGVPVEVTEVLPIIVVESGEVPALPQTVETKTKGGETISSKVNWKSGYDYTQNYATIWVQGIIEGTELMVAQQVEVIPEASKLVYYIDCGTENTGSDTFDKVKGVAENLKNTVSDQTYDSERNTWGVGGANNLKTDNSYTSATEKRYTGFYGNNNSTEPIRYNLQLDPGNYKLTMQAYEWWSGPRTMNFDAVITEKGVTRVVTLAEEIGVSSSSKNVQASGVVSLMETTNITVQLTPTTHEASAISFLAVETTTETEKKPDGEVDDSIDSIYGSIAAGAVVEGNEPSLPDMIPVKTKDGRIVDAVITWDSYEKDAFDIPYNRVTVGGSVICPVTGEVFEVSTFVEVVPENLVYFIDCGMEGSGSLAYNAVSALVPGLNNKSADQKYDGTNAWGYGGIDGSYTSDSACQKYFAGHYGANKSSTPVTYTLPLSQGTYDITLLVHNWWGSRSMSVELVYADEDSQEVVIPIQQNYVVNGHNENSYQKIEKTLVVSNDTVATLRFTADANQDGAIINFIGVAKTEVDADVLESVCESVPLQVVNVNSAPLLPANLKAMTVGGDVIDAPVTWDYNSADYTVPYSRVKVNGTVDGTELQVSALVEVIPEHLVYYIDGGKAGTGSEIYDAIKAMGVELNNEVCDKDYNGSDGWGVSGYEGAYTGTYEECKELTGYYGKNDGTPIIYTLPMSAGAYHITAKMHEWWSGPRIMDVKASYSVDGEGKDVVIASAVQVSSTDADKTVSGVLTLEKDCVVMLSFGMAGGNEAPVVSFVGVSKADSGEENPEKPDEEKPSENPEKPDEEKPSDTPEKPSDEKPSDTPEKPDEEKPSENPEKPDEEKPSDTSEKPGFGGNTRDEGNGTDELSPNVDWDSFEDEVDKIVQGKAQGDKKQPLKNINVITGNNIVVPANVLRKLQQKPVTLAMFVRNGIALSITGWDIPGDRTYSDFHLTARNSNVPEAVIKEVTEGASTYKQIAFAGSSTFEMRLNIHFSLGKENAAKSANLYMYSAEKKEYVYMGSFMVTDNGQAMFGLERRGDYLVTVTEDVPRNSADVIYVVKSGDSMWAIAHRNRMMLSELLAKNPQIVNAGKIYPGQKIVIK